MDWPGSLPGGDREGDSQTLFFHQTRLRFKFSLKVSLAPHLQELAALQGVSPSDWTKYGMHHEPDALMRSFIGNALLA